MSTPFVTVDRTGPIGRVTLDRPDRRNPLSLQMMREATAAVRELGDDPSCGVVVLTGSGPVLSAGHELSEMVDRTLEQEREVFDTCVELMESLQAIRQPVIAEVQGHAIAAGCQLVATCDLAVAVDTARFGTPGVKIGLFCRSWRSCGCRLEPAGDAAHTTAPSSLSRGSSPMRRTRVTKPPMKAATAKKAAQPGTSQPSITVTSR